MYDTIEQALSTKKAEIIDIKENFGGTGHARILGKKAQGKKVYWVVRYNNDQFSKAV